MLLAIAGLQSAALATDLVVERVVIIKHPIPTPYFAAMAVKAGHAESTFHEAKKAYGTRTTGDSEIEIRPHMVLKNVQPHTWGTFTLHLDPKDSVVTTHEALRQHVGRFEILSGSHDNLFIPTLNSTPFMYRIYWRTH